jgi:hypothetical protein
MSSPLRLVLCKSMTISIRTLGQALKIVVA